MKNTRTREENIQRTKEEYQGAKLNCDIVMKGGITSGVVYPLALCELAKTYTFKSIGGASAGAIGAAAAAAAEYGRTNGGTSYAEFEELPAWFGIVPEGEKNSNLYNLFQPQKSTKKIFNILITGILHGGSFLSTALFMLLTGVKEFPFTAIMGSIPGIIMLVLTSVSTRGISLLYCIAVSVLLIFIGVAGAIGYSIYRNLSGSIPGNFFGMCRGVTEAGPGGPKALSDWLSELIDRLAGLDAGEKPLTLGDLKSKDINLLTITTNLSNGIPHTIPFIKNIYYFNPDEFRTIFPEKVVGWMEKHPRDDSESEFRQKFKDRGLIPLPDADDLPVVFAARLSLSFPLLLSTVPLYAIDYTRVSDEKKVPEPCWFSDGGICSNFPIHFFDKPLPGWPTFAINLKDFHPDHPKSTDNSKNVWMPETNRGGTLASWHRFDRAEGNKVFAFVGAIKNAMMNWRDTTQMSVPGYRDRIVHVSVSDDEGGLNMNMPPEIIQSLGDRGMYAGKKLVEVFTNPDPEDGRVSWNNHRWVRFRSTLPLVIDNLSNINTKLGSTESQSSPTYKFLINNQPSYKWDFTEQELNDFIHELSTFIKWWDDKMKTNPDADPRKGAPRPEPELRIMPRV